MSDEQKKPEQAKKRSKKLELKKETIQELSDSDLDQVAGGDATGATAGPPSCADCKTFLCRTYRPSIPPYCPKPIED